MSLAAKKRRRRKVDESVDENPPRSPGGTDSKMGVVEAGGEMKTTRVDADDEGGEDEDDSNIVGGVVMPTLPSGLSADDIQRVWRSSVADFVPLFVRSQIPMS